MEIVGKNIPHLQSAIESVSAGIAETTKVKGPAPIISAFDSFSSAQIGTFGSSNLLPAVADVAQFQDPVAYFQTAKNSGFVPSEFVRILKDQRFNPSAELTSVAQNNFIDRLGDKIGKITYRIPSPSELTIPRPEPAQLTSQNHESQPALAYVPQLKDRAAEPNNVISAAMEKGKQVFTQHEPEYLDGEQPTGLTTETHRNEQESAKVDGVLPGDNSPGTAFNPILQFNKFKKTELQGSADQTETIKNASEKAKTSYVPKEPEYLQGDLPPANSTQSDSASKADQRGIIIVGGKTEGTYLETIDDTLAKMNQNPLPETVQLFQHQLGALQDMSATVNQTVQMNQQLSSAAFSAKMRL